MWSARTQPDLARISLSQVIPTVWYSVLGVPVAVGSDVEQALQVVDQTYAAFRQVPAALSSAFVVQLRRLAADDGYLVCDSRGYQRHWHDSHPALLDLLDRLVHGVLAQLHAQGIYAIHAGTVVYQGGALMIAGRSGQGKTTLVLGLLRRGLGLLSDEFAVADPATQQILPYRRSLHIRPGTPELIPELRFLNDRPQHQLGGGIEWALELHELERSLPGCLAESAPLRYVLLLEGTPQPEQAPTITSLSPALATIAVLRGTWAASVDFAGGLAQVGRLLNGAACARLRAGGLEATLDSITQWLETQRG
jgi:hypothetical protein